MHINIFRYFFLSVSAEWKTHAFGNDQNDLITNLCYVKIQTQEWKLRYNGIQNTFCYCNFSASGMIFSKHEFIFCVAWKTIVQPKINVSRKFADLQFTLITAEMFLYCTFHIFISIIRKYFQFYNIFHCMTFRRSKRDGLLQ